MSVERFAVNAVSDQLAASPRLEPEITSSDRVPITDGHIDFYRSADRTKEAHIGRVPVQVKGRVVRAKVKRKRETQSFSVERSVLRFFRNHGGGLYFYVTMGDSGAERDVFYAILLPFKIDRLIAKGNEQQKTFNVKLSRLPSEASKMEGVVRLAWEGRNQQAVLEDVGQLLNRAERVTVHSLEGISESRPTRLVLDEMDYVVIAHLPDGLNVPVDIDLDLVPGDYVEQTSPVPVACGSVLFPEVKTRRLDENSINVVLSGGLQFRLTQGDDDVNVNYNLVRWGSFADQARDFSFMFNAASGLPLRIGDSAYEVGAEDSGLASEMEWLSEEAERCHHLFNEIGVEDAFAATIDVDASTRSTLSALFEALVEDRSVKGSADGVGQFAFPVGEYQILGVILPMEEEGHRRVVDPFDPSKRDRFRIYQTSDDGSAEPITWGTVYESLSPAELTVTLNLRLKTVVDAYAALSDRLSARVQANGMVLRLLTASDMTSQGDWRRYLLQGAARLAEWLKSQEPDSVVYSINDWQARHRLGLLTAADRTAIRKARRSLTVDQDQRALLEICLLILLGDEEEAGLVAEELTVDERVALRSWPIGALLKVGRGT